MELFGRGGPKRPILQLLFLGCLRRRILELRAVLDFSDAMVFVVAVPNLIALYLFAPMVKRELNDHLPHK